MLITFTAPPAARRVRCHCGHASQAHEHYRRGSDCSECGCDHFRAQRRRLLLQHR